MRLSLLCVGADSRPGRSRSHAHTAELSRRRENHSPAILTECFLMKRSNTASRSSLKSEKRDLATSHKKTLNKCLMSNGHWILLRVIDMTGNASVCVKSQSNIQEKLQTLFFISGQPRRCCYLINGSTGLGSMLCVFFWQLRLT